MQQVNDERERSKMWRMSYNWTRNKSYEKQDAYTPRCIIKTELINQLALERKKDLFIWKWLVKDENEICRERFY